MANPDRAGPVEPVATSAAEVSIRIGAGATLEARITTAGLLSVGALVSGILLSSAVIVLAAGRKSMTGREVRLQRVDDR